MAFAAIWPVLPRRLRAESRRYRRGAVIAVAAVAAVIMTLAAGSAQTSPGTAAAAD